MLYNLTRIILVVILSTLLYSGKVDCQEMRMSVYNSQQGSVTDTVLLGGMFPVHGTSDTKICTHIRDHAYQRPEAMIFAVNSINKNPYLLPNITLAFSIRDSCTNPRHALQEAFKYVQDKNASCGASDFSSKPAVSGVVAATFSRVTVEVADLLSLHEIPLISGSSTADILSDRSRFDYFFRTIPPDSLQAKAIADIIKKFNWTYVFALHTNDQYGVGGIEALIEVLDDSVCIAMKISLPATAEKRDYDEALHKMNKAWINNASVAVLFGHVREAGGMMQAIMDAKNNVDFMLHDLTWIGTDSWGDTLPQEYRETARGMLGLIPRAVEYKEFDQYFTSLHPLNYTDNVWFEEFWETRFNCSINTTCNLRDESITLNTPEHQQIRVAALLLDAVTAFAHALHNLVESECQDGRLCDRIMVDRLVGRAVNGQMLRQQLLNVSFVGPSSNRVIFNSKVGKKPGAYFINNLKTESDGQYSFKVIGYWDNTNPEPLSLSLDEIEWATGDEIPQSSCSLPCSAGYERIPVDKLPHACCWTCSPCQSLKGVSNGSRCTNCNESYAPNANKTNCVPIQVTFLKWSDAWALVPLIITVLGLAATTCVIILFLVFRNHKVIKASSREITAILLVGLVLCYLVPFFFVAKPSSAICGIRRFIIGFCFSVCYSALLVKTNRIHRIFNQQSPKPNKQPKFIGSISQVVFTLILICIQVVIGIVWLAVEHPSTKNVYAANTGELRCGESPLIGLSVSLAYNFLLLLLSTYFAFRTRKVPENFNEAQYINVTLYTLCVVWLAFIPTYIATVAVKLGAIFQTTSITVAVILSATTTLLCLFIPRIILLISKIKNDKDTTMNSTGHTDTMTSTCKSTMT